MADFYNIKLFCELCNVTVYEDKLHLDDGEIYDLPSGETVASKYFRGVGWCMDCKGDKLIYAPYPVTEAIHEISRLQSKLRQITSSWTFRTFGFLMTATQARSKKIQQKILKQKNIIEFARTRADYERQYCIACGSSHIIPLTKRTKSIELITHTCGEVVACQIDTGDYAWTKDD
jgi:hypothetical protein